MAHAKREVLKFIRIKVRPSHLSGDSDPDTVSGYLNTYKEFSRYDTEHQQGFTSLTGSQEADFSYTTEISGVKGSTLTTTRIALSPKTFFVGPIHPSFRRGVGFVVDENDYQNLSFIINGVHVPYDRRN